VISLNFDRHLEKDETRAYSTIVAKCMVASHQAKHVVSSALSCSSCGSKRSHLLFGPEMFVELARRTVRKIRVEVQDETR
jgi:Zn finger protein HypA/HybF involved in hydrogenase expression